MFTNCYTPSTLIYSLIADLDIVVGLKAVQLVEKFQHGSLNLTITSFLTVKPLGTWTPPPRVTGKQMTAAAEQVKCGICKHLDLDSIPFFCQTQICLSGTRTWTYYSWVLVQVCI